MALSTFGKWWIGPPHHYLKDAFSGQLPVFYNYVSDGLLNLLAFLLNWPPMVVQVFLYGPLLAALLVVAGYFSLKPVLKNSDLALTAVLVIALGVNSGLAGGETSVVLHVPFHTLTLATAQSLGWVFFLPCLSLLYLARHAEQTESRWKYSLALGVCLGALFHVHTLTFINVSAIQLAYLVAEVFGVRPRRVVEKAAAGLLGVLVVVFLFRHVAQGISLSFGELAGFGMAALVVTALADRQKSFYLLGYGALGVVALPYALAILSAGSLLSEGAGNPLSVTVKDILLFYSVYWIAAACAFRFYRQEESAAILRWCGAMVVANLFLGFNHLWGWSNHPYRYIINLIFPLGILTAIAIFHSPRWIRRAVAAWMIIVIAGAIFQFAQGRRIYANVNPGSAAEASFLAGVKEATAGAAAGPQWILNPPEFNYPQGVVQSSLLMNYTNIPGYIPDFRYETEPERYLNRLAFFCFLFPDYPHFEIQFKRRACTEDYGPDPAVTRLKIRDDRVRTSLISASGIRFAGAIGQPFFGSLSRAAQTYQWPVTHLPGLPDDAGPFFWSQTTSPRLEGLIFPSQIAYDKQGFSATFSGEKGSVGGEYWLVLGGRKLLSVLAAPRLDGAELLSPDLPKGNWAICAVTLKPSAEHHLELHWAVGASTGAEALTDSLYFAALVRADRFTAYFSQ